MNNSNPEESGITRKKTRSESYRSSQRDAILTELRALDSYPTADDLYDRLRERLPRLSLGTVYRNLELLVNQGVIVKLSFCGKQNRFDANTISHHHWRCDACGRICNLNAQEHGVELNWILHQVLRETACHSYELVLNGRCPECRIPNRRNEKIGEVGEC